MEEKHLEFHFMGYHFFFFLKEWLTNYAYSFRLGYLADIFSNDEASLSLQGKQLMLEFELSNCYNFGKLVFAIVSSTASHYCKSFFVGINDVINKFNF